MRLIVILGPTSTGKTSIALELCKRFSGEIISADSRQIYKYMDIGTGKLPLDDKGFNVQKFDGFWKVNKIPIYMYDVVCLNVKYSVYSYVKKARNEIESIGRRGKVPFVVGGSGFYIDVLVGRQPISCTPPDYALRDELQKKSLEDLRRQLYKLDRDSLSRVDVNNKVRLIRAIELEVHKNEKVKERFPTNLFSDLLFIGLTASRRYLYERADLWVEKVVEKGLILETKKLMDLGYENTAPMKGLVYSTVVDYLRGRKSFDKMKEEIKFDLHSYIRRQLTYFNRNADVIWFDIKEKGFDTKVFEKVKSFLDGNT